MDIYENDGGWKPRNEVLDVRSVDGSSRYDELREKSSRGEIKNFLVRDSAYNQKQLEYILVCEWWEMVKEEDDV